MEKLEEKFENMDVKHDASKEEVYPDVITPEFVSQLTNPTSRFLCKLKDNGPKFKFGGFKIRDMISKITLVDVPDQDDDSQMSDEDDPETRAIKYHLGPDFLKLRTVGLTLNFGIGPEPINKLEMVERHYFRGKVIRSYDFKFGFVIPNSTNSWEFIYDLPVLTPEEEDEII